MKNKPKYKRPIQNVAGWLSFVIEWQDHDFESDPRTITCEPYKKNKTIPQVRSIHMLIRQISDHTGDDFEYLKEALKIAIGVKIEGRFDVEVAKSFADYSIDEAKDFIEKLMHLASEHFGLILEIESE